MMANNVIRAGTLGNNKFHIIHIFRQTKFLWQKRNETVFATLKYIHAYRKQC